MKRHRPAGSSVTAMQTKREHRDWAHRLEAQCLQHKGLLVHDPRGRFSAPTALRFIQEVPEGSQALSVPPVSDINIKLHQSRTLGLFPHGLRPERYQRIRREFRYPIRSSFPRPPYVPHSITRRAFVATTLCLGEGHLGWQGQVANPTSRISDVSIGSKREVVVARSRLVFRSVVRDRGDRPIRSRHEADGCTFAGSLKSEVFTR